MKRRDAVHALASIERIGRRHEPGLGAQKLALLDLLAHGRLRTARQVLRLHDLLCNLEAWPDDRRVHTRVRRMLRVFRERADLRRHRRALAGSGIAGTDIPYRFFWPTAHWISRSWPGALVLDRSDPEHMQAILEVLPSLLDPVRAEWLRGRPAPPIAVLDCLRPEHVTDADFLIGLVAAMPGDEASREALFDRVDPPFVLLAGRNTPQRTTARFDWPSVYFRARPVAAARPDIRDESRKPPRRVLPLRGAAVDALIRLARFQMITRERDVAVFQYPDRRGAFLIDDGRGLAFAMLGLVDARRALLPATHAGLTLQNGVPVGYVQLDVLGRHAALSFNVFSSFRGADTARIFARLIAAAHHVFGCEVFSIEPYQLGAGNDEGIESGAWWFYYRQGFRPRAAAVRRIATREIARRKARPRHRSSARTLRALSRSHLFYSLDPSRTARLPRVDAWLAAAVQVLTRFGDADPAARQAAATRAAFAALGARGIAVPTGAMRAGLDRWAGLALALTAQGRWSLRERRELLRLIESKAGTSERDFQRRVLRHCRLRKLLDC